MAGRDIGQTWKNGLSRIGSRKVSQANDREIMVCPLIHPDIQPNHSQAVWVIADTARCDMCRSNVIA